MERKIKGKKKKVDLKRIDRGEREREKEKEREIDRERKRVIRWFKTNPVHMHFQNKALHIVILIVVIRIG